MEMKPYELVDAFWKNWGQSLSMMSSAGKQMEQMTMEALKQQQETLHKVVEGMQTMEQEFKRYMAQASTQYVDYMKQLTGGQFVPQLEEWQSKWNELLQQMQQFSTSPTKTSLSLLSQTSEQLEEALKQVVQQQQQQREELQGQMTSFLHELKAMQLDLAKRFEENSKAVFAPMK
ncbi:polyhydroxyalkanoic acid inclusion protein PhaP [Ectobacillus ponti]|uniref:Polyhydroxyalkanoic acid inclusion protein PhaP n=1 Tax=Ectobacillus ponti TaxID=2961894 RepID=A0AA41X891_9BACI|nr:polyhydroxyalkanoic acid inclusion protein PhaP [Ectobacillus ponti]MCP8968509.1 polyhydroxyalkanoic acid inclusion protein PhaP [Ectobacillus ponti]